MTLQRVARFSTQFVVFVIDLGKYFWLVGKVPIQTGLLGVASEAVRRGIESIGVDDVAFAIE